MDIQVNFPGGKRVDATVGAHVVRTDQPATPGGDATAPTPFDLFLASLATCAGIYVLGFCQSRGIPAHGIGITQHPTYDAATKRLTRVGLEIRLPSGFPEKYRAAVIQAAAGCKVKQALDAPPEFDVTAPRAVSDSGPGDGEALEADRGGA